jgi:hypothetical protein
MNDDPKTISEMKLLEMERATSQLRFSKIQLLISILAGLPVVVLCLIMDTNLFFMATWTSIAIAVFWLLGNMVRFFLQTKVFPPPEIVEPNEDEESGNEEGADDMGDNPEKTNANDYMASE